MRRVKTFLLLICFLAMACNAHALSESDLFKNPTFFVNGKYAVNMKYFRILEIKKGNINIIDYLIISTHLDPAPNDKNNDIDIHMKTQRINPKKYKDGRYYQLITIKGIGEYRKGQLINMKGLEIIEGNLHPLK